MLKFPSNNIYFFFPPKKANEYVLVFIKFSFYINSKNKEDLTCAIFFTYDCVNHYKPLWGDKAMTYTKMGYFS